MWWWWWAGCGGGGSGLYVVVWTLVVPLVQNLLQYVVCVDLDVVVVVGEEKKRRGMDTSAKVPISPGRDGDGDG